MFISQLNSFISIVELASINQAAKKQNISQQALSKSLQIWEQGFGFALFERSKKGVELTPQGQWIYEAALEMRAIWQQQLQRIQALETIRGTYRIAFTPFAERGCMSEVMAFFKYFPRIRLERAYMQLADALLAAEKGDIDLVLTSQLTQIRLHSDFLVRYLVQSLPLGIQVHRQHPLAQRAQVSLEELKNETIIFEAEAENEYNLLLKKLAGDGLTHIVLVDTALTTEDLVQRNLGISIDVDSRKRYQSSSIRWVPLQESYDIEITGWYKEDSDKNHLVAALLTQLSQGAGSW